MQHAYHVFGSSSENLLFNNSTSIGMSQFLSFSSTVKSSTHLANKIPCLKYTLKVISLHSERFCSVSTRSPASKSELPTREYIPFHGLLKRNYFACQNSAVRVTPGKPRGNDCSGSFRNAAIGTRCRESISPIRSRILFSRDAATR